ncbi:MAG: hypothetical protein A2341_11095 [Deltaproteobacteria bacterium RIFOXYB12_FULL_58_9]|nr:MAG: hypothetical protein A2341_11095 [Deltaproteobacteria bacterium RIFOXYB12_FULL_58_9]
MAYDGGVLRLNLQAAVCAAVVLFAHLPHASAGADITRYRPPMTTDGLLSTDTSETLHPWQLSGAAYLTYTSNPLVWRYADDTYEPVIDQQLTLDLVAAIGVMSGVDVALALPIVFMQSGPNNADLGGLELAGAGFGDLRLTPRINILRERSWGFGLAILPELSFPTGTSDRLMGDPSVAFRPRAVATLPIHKIFPARFMASIGFNIRRNDIVGDQDEVGDELELQDEWLYQIGGEVDFEPFGVPVVGLLDFVGASTLTAPFADNGLSSLEVIVGARTRALSDYVFTVGVGGGLTRAVGTSAYRFIFGVAWAPLPPDSDNDGIPDVADDCPFEPEDYDQYDDTDGCPDLDNDGDGILDTKDACPTEPEDKNQIDDDDGCPDAGAHDQDGDGVLDIDDDCPSESEDLDYFDDQDGCPDSDHDFDGVPNEKDDCPDEKETINGIDDDDGCVDEGEGVTEYVEDSRIEIKETILFESGKSTIKQKSNQVLDQVALQILAHPEVKLIRVEGHTDSLGNDEDNLYLSQDRADSVRRYLIGKGVPKGKVQAVGFGETKPIDTNATPAGRTKNRRVEFVIAQPR